MVKIVAISDTHNRLEDIKVPKGDILLHAGDATVRGTYDEIVYFNDCLGKLPFEKIIFTPGNHDFLFQQDPHLAKSLMTNCTVLLDEEVIIDGIKFYGSPWTPFFHNWAFNLYRGEPLKEKWDLIPDDTDVLITHGPPYGILDEVPRWYHGHPVDSENVGCEELAKKVATLDLKLHVMGHLHESRGSIKIENTTYINAACMDEKYSPTNKPFVFEVSND